MNVILISNVNKFGSHYNCYLLVRFVKVWRYLLHPIVVYCVYVRVKLNVCACLYAGCYHCDFFPECEQVY